MKVPEIETYQREKYQPSLLDSYVKNQVEYLSTKYPNKDKKLIESIVKSTIKDRIQSPKLAVVHHEIYGESELRKVDLLKHTNDMSDRIVTPSGSTYMKPKNTQSFIKSLIQDKLKERKAYKNAALDHKARGEKTQASVKNAIQSRIKITVNSISGIMGSPHNCLYDPAGYNAITATCRHGCMVGYGHSERLLEGNFYLPTEDAAINWIILLKHRYPGDDAITLAVEKYKLYQPTVEDIVNHFSSCIFLYTTKVNRDKLYDLLNSLSQNQHTFIYYACNLKHLFRTNEAITRPWLDDLFKIPDVSNPDPSIDPKDIFKVDEDLRIMVTSIYPELLEGKLLFDTIDTYPDIPRRVITICKYFEQKIGKLQYLFDTFLNIYIDLPNALGHRNMMRKTVIVSDTDSVIFTTKSWIEWYSKGINYNKTSYQINAFIIYLLTKSLIHTFAIMSMNMGIEGEDLRKIAMKNEFLYPVMLRTAMGKHYAGIVSQQEGRVYDEVVSDIKGKNFRGSDLCSTTIKHVKSFLLELIDSYMQNFKLSARDIIDKVLAIEYGIVDSIENSQTTYLGTTPIKQKEEYANPESSSYFYYMLWEDIFAEKYDHIYIPQKCHVVPIYNTIFKSPEYLENLKQTSPKIHSNILKFLSKYPKKNITRILVPTHIGIPKEIVPIINLRNIIYSNTYPLYLAIRGLGIGTTFKNKTMLLSDMYGDKKIAF